jgi:recombination protein RecA
MLNEEVLSMKVIEVERNGVARKTKSSGDIVSVDAGMDAALRSALSTIEKQFGKGAIMLLGESERQTVDAVSTGCLGLDVALGVGGIPRGRITEIYGMESSGKTTLALHVVAEAQKAGGVAAVIDAEHALDPEYARRIGVDLGKVLVSQPDSGEEALEIADVLVRSGAVDVVVIDSVAALVPKAEIEGEMGDAHVGLQARLMSQAMRKLTASIGRTNTAVIFINQIREKIGVMFGNPETTPGGRALKFYASVRLEVRPTENIKDGVDITGRRVKVKVVKNKVAPPFRQVEMDIMFGAGISRSSAILDLGVELKLVEKTGSWFTYGDTRIGQGRENAKRYLDAHPEVMDEIEQLVRQSTAGDTLLTIGSADDVNEDQDEG